MKISACDSEENATACVTALEMGRLHGCRPMFEQQTLLRVHGGHLDGRQAKRRVVYQLRPEDQAAMTQAARKRLREAHLPPRAWNLPDEVAAAGNNELHCRQDVCFCG